MTTRIHTNIEAIRANGEFTGWRTQHYPPSSRLSSRQSGRKIFLLIPCHQALERYPCPPRTPVLGYRATSLARFSDAILALPELLFWVTGLRPLQVGFSLEGCPLQRAGQAPTKLPSILGSFVLLPFFLVHPLVRFLLLSLKETFVFDSWSSDKGGKGGEITLVVPTSPRRLPKSLPRHLPTVPGEKPRQKPWARRSSF